MITKPSRPCPTRVVEEPDLQDLLADPTTHLVMQSDGVSQDDLVGLLAVARRRLHGESGSLSRRSERV